MSAYPPPPGLSSPSVPSASSSSSLPARPPPSNTTSRFRPAFNGQSSGRGGSQGGNNGPQSFTGFAPRALASHATSYRNSSPVTPAAPQMPSAYGGPQHQHQHHHQQQQQQQAPGSYYSGYQGQQHEVSQSGYMQQNAPQIRNPFAPPTVSTAAAAAAGPQPGYSHHMQSDPDMDAQIAQWQSAYLAKEEKPPQKAGTQANSTGLASASTAGKEAAEAKGTVGVDDKPKTVQRSGGGQKWSDNTLLEWDPAHFRIFVGNLAGEVTDDSLLKAFVKYPSVQKARVIRDKLTTKSKGYGFVSFSDGDDYFRAARDMQNKYIGSHPVKIKKSTTEIKPVAQKDKRYNNKTGSRAGGNRDQQQHQRGGSSSNNNGILGPAPGAGISKKQSKTKGGLKILG